MAERAGRAVAPPQRLPGNPAPPTDNGLSAEQEREVIYRARKKAITDIMAEKEAHDALGKAIGKRLTEARQTFKRDTSIELQDLDAILRVSRLERVERSKSVVNFNWMAEMEGLAPGGQMSLFGAMLETQQKTPDPIKIALEWETDARIAYRANRECKPPADCPADMITRWTKAWHDEQETVIWSMAEHGKIVDRDPDMGVGGAIPLDPEPDDEDEPFAEGAAAADDDADPDETFVEDDEPAEPVVH